MSGKRFFLVVLIALGSVQVACGNILVPVGFDAGSPNLGPEGGDAGADGGSPGPDGGPDGGNLDAGSPFAIPVETLRIQVDWSPGEVYTVGPVRIEPATEALPLRATIPDPFGSYKAVLKDATTGATLAYDGVGTGKEYRLLVRAMTFRFPLPTRQVRFELTAENRTSGVMEKVLSTLIDPSTATRTAERKDVDVRLLKGTSATSKVKVVFYAEGYPADGASRFWSTAANAVSAIPGFGLTHAANFEYWGVFAPSNLPLDDVAQNLGLPVPDRDSFLGLYYPYWDNFGRWQDVVYPTREEHFRDALAQTPYDYPLVLVDSFRPFGCGNYRAFIAVPAQDFEFTFTLKHEFGHIFGLNEEYSSGGRTELEFAPGIQEPWSQNLTFLRSTSYTDLKWDEFVSPTTQLPTPLPFKANVYGAYLGGYSQSDPAQAHIPGGNCVMGYGSSYCPICLDGIEHVSGRDLGHPELPELTLSELSLLGNTVPSGSTLSIQATAANVGEVLAGGTSVAFHLSLDAVFGGADDVALTPEWVVSPLDPKASTTNQTGVTVTAPPGTYYVCGKVDPSGSIDERNETNNSRCSNAPVTVTAPK
jgi:hypothetical protein